MKLGSSAQATIASALEMTSPRIDHHDCKQGTISAPPRFRRCDRDALTHRALAYSPMATTDLTLDAGQLTAALSEPPTRRTFLVIHVEGEEASSSVLDVPDSGEVTIGRSRGATVVVDHEKVSRIHARFRRYGERLDLEDLESRNGTRVNGERIEGVRALAPGDEISIGPATIFVGIASP